LRKLLLLPLIPLLFSFTMCGHRGAPKPPLIYRPATPQVHPPAQEYDSPLVWWERVDRFGDGRKISQPQKVSYRVIVNFGKREVEVKKNYFKDSPIRAGEKRCYSVVALYEGHESQRSEPVCTTGEKPIEDIPEVIKAHGGDGFVEIELAPHPGYEVEVFKDAEEPFLKPYALLREEENTFTDRRVVNGRSYTYLLRFSKERLKGRFTEPLAVIPEDRVPPAPPKEALLIKGKECILVWEPSPSEDVRNYLIVADGRKFKTGGIYFRFTGCPAKVELFAVDKAGNLSKPIVPEVVDEEGGGGDGEQVGPAGNGGLHKDP